MKEIRWGILGCGDVAEHKSGPALYSVEHSHLVAVMSRREEKAAGFAQRHGAARFYTSAEKLIADEDVNAIYIATPPSVHAEMTEMAAEAGKLVLCEMPMAMNEEECRRMIEVCSANDVQLIIAYYRRFFPVVVKMKQLVVEGAIGTPMRIHCNCSALYAPRADGERAWLVDENVAGGGFLTDVVTHRLDLMTYFLGQPTAVGAFVDTQSLDVTVDDASSLILRFESGAHGTAIANWNLDMDVDDFEIAGTEGRIVTRSLSTGGKLTCENAQGKQRYKFPAPRITHLHLVEHVVACLRNGTTNQLDGAAGMQATRITDTAYQSARAHRIVSL